MANKNFPHGLTPVETLHGGPITTMPYSTIAAYAVALLGGDAVMQATDGNLNRFAVPGTNRISGVAAHSRAASTLQDVLVYEDANIIFEIQDDGTAGPTGTGFQKADKGLNANLVLGAGDAVRDVSTDQLDATTLAVTATLDLKVLDRVANDSNAYGANCRIRVLINKHRLNREVVGI